MSDQIERMLRKKIKQMSDFSRSPEMQNLKKDVMDIANDVKREFTSAQTGRDRAGARRAVAVVDEHERPCGAVEHSGFGNGESVALLENDFEVRHGAGNRHIGAGQERLDFERAQTRIHGGGFRADDGIFQRLAADRQAGGGFAGLHFDTG